MSIREVICRSTEGGWGGPVFLMLSIEAILGILFLVEAAAFSWLGSPDAPPECVVNASVVDVGVSADGATGVSVLRVQYGAYDEALKYVAVCHQMRSAKQVEVIAIEHGQPLQVEYSPTEELVAIGCDDGSLYLLRTDDEPPVPELLLRNPRGRMDQIAFSPDGRLLVGLDDLSLNVWSVASGVLNVRLSNAPESYCRFAFVPGSQSVLLGNMSGVIYRWNFAEQTPATKFASTGGPIRHLICSSDGHRVVAVGIDGVLHAWDLDSKKLLWQQRQVTPYAPSTVVFSADSETIVSAVAAAHEETDKSVALTVRDAETGTPLGRLVGHTHRVSALAATSGVLVHTGSHDGTVRTWNTRSREEVRRFSLARDFAGRLVD